MNQVNTQIKVRKSNLALDVQIVIDGKTIVGKKHVFSGKETPMIQAKTFGEEFAKFVPEGSRISFDRGKSLYHGVVKEFAQGLRSKGIRF